MRHSSYDAQCSVCKENAGEVEIQGGVLWENNLWLVRHSPPPYALAGWTMFHAQRHVQSPAHFNDAEAASFGPVLRHVTRTLEIVTGAPRVYFMAFGESVPHMHVHIAPRYASLPASSVAFGIADLYRTVTKGEVKGATAEEAMSVAQKLKLALTENPPPG